MDECDKASDYAARLNRDALARHLSQGRATGESRTECVDCGEVIPEGRRKAQAGCTRCVRCQNDYERSPM